MLYYGPLDSSLFPGYGNVKLVCILNWCASHIKSVVIVCTPGWRRKRISYQCFHISYIRVVLSFHCVRYWEVSNIKSIFLFHFFSLPSPEAPDNIVFQNGLELLLEAESDLKWKSNFYTFLQENTLLCKVSFLIPHHICHFVSIDFVSWYYFHDKKLKPRNFSYF